MNKISGAYKITNTITGDFYIGSSKSIKVRWATHKIPSMWSRFSNLRMYQDMAQYGLNNFKFEIIEETDNLKEREQYWIEQLRPKYNTCRAKGLDIERRKEWYKTHLGYMKEWRDRLCFYNNKTITLSALSQRFRRQGIPHATLEAKKYLIQ